MWTKPRTNLSKLLTTAIGMSLLAGSLAACSGTNSGADNGSAGQGGSAGNAGAADSAVAKEGMPIVQEPITLSLMAPDVGHAKWEDMAVLKEMEKLTNIKLTFQNAPQDSFETKKNLVFASGSYPDIFYAADLKPAEQVTYGSQGVLIPLEGLIDGGYAPNLKKILDENPQIRKNITTPDGHIYALPNVDLTAVWYRSPMWYNGSFLKKLGVSELPKTTDEFYAYLKRVKAEDANGNGKADEIPLTSTKLDDLRMFFFGFWGMYDEVIYADKDGKVHYSPQEEGYKGYLTFMNKLWSEELLDHETFSQTDEQKKAKGKNNQVAVFNDYYPYFTMGGEPSREHPMMQPLQSEIAGTPVYGKHPGQSANGVFAISKTNPNPEATMRWADYQYGYEGSLLFSQGPENVLWKYSDKATLTKEPLEVPGGGSRDDYKGTLTPNYGILPPGVNLPENNKGLQSDFDAFIAEENEKKLVPIGKIPFPNVFLTPEEQSEVTAMLSDMNPYVEQMEAKFITGQEPLSGWDKYAAQLKKMGSDRIVEIYQAAYDRWNGSK
ncbi:extracellular solute-binding protein [Paenibacillus pasadenensis]|uniref:ABC transporter, substrate-binding protein n=1 Tax=Paenibacillus pasadenensis TaxID=217090 RepID=A0A2N5ND23_9BACL|nr:MULTISPECIES: extracellular solute-binding protein [Paenibacillus]PLT48247.1 ABC transporter, substrate-binding protein [Paenibacillus pasadenensis]